MLVIFGYLVVILTVFGGFALSGGSLAALYQPLELVIIGGGAVGAFVVANNGKAIKATMKAFPHMMQGSHYTKALYMDLIAVMYLLLSKIRQTGMISLENDIEDPENSIIFAAYPRVMKDKVLLNFVLDYLRLMVSGAMNTFEMEALMDEEIETLEHEHEVPINALNQVGDGLPAFGIVAAVMGVVNALAAADRPAAELGELIAHAMVGTFLGILLAYGFVLPLGSLLSQKSREQVKMLQCIKVTLLSSLSGYAPQIAVEFGRKILFTTERPSFMELEEHVRQVKTSNNGTSSSSESAP